jgi:hypothetical protein
LSGHTLGPWVYDEEDSCVNGPKRLVCDLPFIGDGCSANGRLIAAAPDLLEALVEIREVCGIVTRAGLKGFDGVAGIAERAIAKATGEGGAS